MAASRGPPLSKSPTTPGPAVRGATLAFSRFPSSGLVMSLFYRKRRRLVPEGLPRWAVRSCKSAGGRVTVVVVLSPKDSQDGRFGLANRLVGRPDVVVAAVLRQTSRGARRSMWSVASTFFAWHTRDAGGGFAQCGFRIHDPMTKGFVNSTKCRSFWSLFG